MAAKKIAFWVAIVVIIGIVGYAGYRLGGENTKIKKQKQWIEQNAGVIFVGTSTVPVGQNSENTEKEDIKNDFDFSSYKVVGDDVGGYTSFQKYSLPKDIASLIEWSVPTKIEKLGFFYAEQGVRTKDLNNESNLVPTEYYIAGSFTFEEKMGVVVFADISCEECFGGIIDPSSMFVLYDGKIVFIEKMSPPNDTYSSKEYLVRKNVLVDSDFFVPGLDLNRKTTVKWKGNWYELVPTHHDNPISRSHINDNATLVFYTDPLLGPVYKQAGRFEIIGHDGRSWYYQYSPKMLGADGNFSVVFENGAKNIYKYVTPAGCGFNLDPVVITDFVTSSLKEVGTAGNGKYKVYTLAGNDQKLHQLYDSMYFPDGENKISYEKFVADKPLVYFYDDFDRLIEVTESKFVPAAECGKPVIYLYPEKTTKISVKVNLSHWSFSEPQYNGGWEVIAEPSGRLTEASTGKNYPYLFWEGTGVGEQPKAETGFVISRDGVPEFLREKLKQLGLNQKESNDFREFWEPRMTRAPYYFVTFYGTGVMNQIAPLNIEPKPDTVIRVLMDYRPLKELTTAKEQKLSAPTRRGFTVIEWGGVLGRE